MGRLLGIGVVFEREAYVIGMLDLFYIDDIVVGLVLLSIGLILGMMTLG